LHLKKIKLPPRSDPYLVESFAVPSLGICIDAVNKWFCSSDVSVSRIGLWTVWFWLSSYLEQMVF
jgi:hypothetical protein